MTIRQWAPVLLLLAMNNFSAAGELDGVYERVSLLNARTGDSPEAANRAGLLIIAHGHYAMMTMNPDRRVLGRDAAAALAPAEELEFLREWLDVNAHSGAIEIEDDSLTWHRQISEDPREVDSSTTLHWQLEGDRLILSFSLPNGDRYDWTWQRRE